MKERRFIKVKCDFCKRIILKERYDVKLFKHHFCNHKCQYHFFKPKVLKKGKYIPCKICGKKYYRSLKRSLSSKYCSKKCRHKADSINFIGSNNPFSGRTHKKNYKFKGSYKSCEICGKEIRLNPSRERENRGRFCSQYCYGISKKESLKGLQNPNWLGGVSKEPYPFIFSEELKEKIRNRDNYECKLCYITEEEHLIINGILLSIHHIDYDKHNCDENNLITLCTSCNARVNFNREYWKEYFKNVKRKKIISKI